VGPRLREVEPGSFVESPGIEGPFETIAHADGGNYSIIVPRGHANDPDPPVFCIDHDDPDQRLTRTSCLSGLLSALDPEQDREILRKLEAEVTSDEATGIRALTAYLKKNPTKAQAFYLRGVAKEELEDWKGAEADFTKALALRPAYIDALLHRANAHEEAGRLKRALVDYDAALSHSIYDATELYNRGIVRSQVAGMDKEALDDFERAFAIDPDDSDFAIGRAFGLLPFGRAEEAIKACIEGMDDEEARHQSTLSECYAAAGREAEALVAAAAALALDEDVWDDLARSRYLKPFMRKPAFKKLAPQ
jgi:tetratricopeptide (TPR) repeat protein